MSSRCKAGQQFFC